MPDIEIKALSPSSNIRAMLSEMLIETVADGGSVGFMHPLAPEAADAFWQDSLASAARGGRIVFGAFDGQQLIGTVTLLLSLPPNQPHRADVAKVLVHPDFRRRGIAAALMREIEARALAAGRSLLVLDTHSDSPAQTLYAGLGYVTAGRVPNYAAIPDGALISTTFMYKELALHAG